ncbi:hypothetical protein ACTXLJ_11855 [Psychrobacter celer]|uniref:hypothetical protein n=1 Tax=Psychrobacter celer TaxID=306572 RepID=UPI002FE4943F
MRNRIGLFLHIPFGFLAATATKYRADLSPRALRPTWHADHARQNQGNGRLSANHVKIMS